MSAEYQTDKRKAVVYAVRNVLLLHHTAAERDQNLRMTALQILERAYISEHPVLGVLANGAGVE